MGSNNEQKASRLGATHDALLSKAFIDGRRSGLVGESPSLNPHLTGSPEYIQWNLGWRRGNSDRAYADAMGCAA